MQRCDREIVDGSAAVGRRREGSKDAAGAAGSSSSRAAAGTLPGLPCARPPGQPPPASIPPTQQHFPRARVASKEKAAFAKKHPDTGELLCGEGPQLGGGCPGAGECEESSQAAILLLPGQRCAAASSLPPGASVGFNFPPKEVVGSLASSSILLLHIEQARTCLSPTQSRPGRARATACTTCAWPEGASKGVRRITGRVQARWHWGLLQR